MEARPRGGHEASLKATRPVSKPRGQPQRHEASLKATRPASKPRGQPQSHEASLKATRPASKPRGQPQSHEASLKATRPASKLWRLKNKGPQQKQSQARVARRSLFSQAQENKVTTARVKAASEARAKRGGTGR